MPASPDAVSSPPPHLSPDSADPSAELRAVLAAAAARTARQAASVEVTVRGRALPGLHDGITRARGQVDFPADRVRLRVLGEVLDGQEVYAEGSVIYARFGQDPRDAFPAEKEWVRLESLEQAEDVHSTASTVLLTPSDTDPRWYLAAVRDLAGDAQRVGSGRVRGQQAERYWVRLVAGEAARRAGGGLALRLTALDEPDTEAEMDVWVTDTGIARLDLTARYLLEDLGGGEWCTTQVRVDLHGAGPADPIQPPPGATVLTAKEFDRYQDETDRRLRLAGS